MDHIDEKPNLKCTQVKKNEKKIEKVIYTKQKLYPKRTICLVSQ